MYRVTTVHVLLYLTQKAAARDVVVSDTSTSGTVDRPASKKEPSKTVSPPTAVTSKPLPPVSKEKEKKKPLCPYGTKCYRYVYTMS